MKKPRHKHDCERCKFYGTDVDGNDWYLCPSGVFGCRTIVMRYGDRGEEYGSVTIGETVVPTRMEIRALRMGLELNDAELIQYGKKYARNAAEYKSIKDSEEGPRVEDENLFSDRTREASVGESIKVTMRESVYDGFVGEVTYQTGLGSYRVRIPGLPEEIYLTREQFVIVED